MRSMPNAPTSSIRPLSRPHACRWGTPVVDRVDTTIFVRTYFAHCMSCTYCGDACCAHGSEVDADNVARVEREAADVARFTGVEPARFWDGTWSDDAERPGGRFTRTRVDGGACVFKSQRGRGCMLHAYALSRGADYHLYKPMVSALFPITWDDRLLHPSTEIGDRSLRCIDDGPTLYRGVRSEIAWYFGDALVAELDAIEAAEAIERQGALAETAIAK